MSTVFEVRRNRHVEATKDDEATARAYVTLHSHFPGQLTVWEVTKSERLIGGSVESIPVRAIGWRGGQR